MKHSILLSLALIMTSCGDSNPLIRQEPAPEVTQPDTSKDTVKLPPCADSKLLGVWPVGNSMVIFNDDCTWTGNDSNNCLESGTYTDSLDYTTFTLLTSKCATQPLPIVQKCNYAFQNSKFYFNCLDQK